jgi:hypothetical protein
VWPYLQRWVPLFTVVLSAAVSFSVVSFIHNVARKDSSVSLAATGMARNVTCCAAVPKMEALAPVPPTPAGASHFALPKLAAPSVLSCFKLDRVCRKGDHFREQFRGGPPSGGSKLQEKGA